MLEACDQISKGHYVILQGERQGQTITTTWIIIGNTVLYDGSFRFDGIQPPTEEELRILWTSNNVYVMAKLKPLECLVAVGM